MELDITRKRRVILVDKDEDLLYVLGIKLRKVGFQAYLSLNGKGLNEIISAHYPDLILLDIKMKDMNGGEICKKLKAAAATRDIRVVLFSASNNIAEIAFLCGADGYLTRPLNWVQFSKECEWIN